MRIYRIPNDEKAPKYLEKYFNECLNEGVTGDEIIILTDYNFTILPKHCGEMARKLKWRYNEIKIKKE